ncbi:hypothetical protein ZHAS_00017904 [Anopheles sinensis]|uniref:Uncharacterized protein n=1 Tax=Anopheles sinensis TaxID=74873 RepID=A0A084WHI0_ANOSI|nr:hypothetical protein ZHAS_00017904 [Anopheles sinensis]
MIRKKHQVAPTVDGRWDEGGKPAQRSKAPHQVPSRESSNEASKVDSMIPRLVTCPPLLYPEEVIAKRAPRSPFSSHQRANLRVPLPAVAGTRKPEDTFPKYEPPENGVHNPKNGEPVLALSHHPEQDITLRSSARIYISKAAGCGGRLRGPGKARVKDLRAEVAGRSRTTPHTDVDKFICADTTESR